MPIRVTCRHCGKHFSAWDDLIGKSVKCPKCQQEMVIQAGNEALAAGPPPAAPVSRGSVAPSPKSPLPPPPPIPQTGPVVPRRVSTPPATTRPAATRNDDLDDRDDLPYACPHCHRSMPADEDLCDHCGYHRILKRRIDISEGIRKVDQSVGFERLFRGQLVEADSADGTLRLIKIIGLLAAAAFLFVCHPWSWLVAVGVGVGLFFYYRQRRNAAAPDTAVDSGDDSPINQDVISSTAWTCALNLQRVVGWRVAAWPFPTTRALTLHDATFTDQDLAQIEDLTSYETLDLEGTQISNAGLLQLERFKQLRFLVFRRTQVTASGVRRLQQALPTTCIWY